MLKKVGVMFATAIGALVLMMAWALCCVAGDYDYDELNNKFDFD